ncbi:MAG: preprotein translocase subunit SecE [Bacteroidota bacterium]|nr:preprotein translocase subunit SecE [Bacteroidota bacterium]
MIQLVRTFILESFDEVRHKVSWPTFNDLQQSTVLVLVASIVFALAIGLVDFVFENGMTWFYRSF